MINDHTTNNLITPVILQVAPTADQIEVAINFINDKLGWNLDLTSAQLKLINQEQEVISIEMIRNLIGELAYASYLGKPRAFVLLSAQQLSIAAQHALLKSLEEPPTNTLFLLISTSQDKLLPTICSRCIMQLHRSTTENHTHEELPPTLDKLITNPNEVSYDELIEFTTAYKDKEQALQLIEQILFALKQSPLKSKQKIKIQQQLLKTFDYLQANVNVRLALESCFFTIKNTF